MVDKRVCVAIKEAISDERTAPPKYRELADMLIKTEKPTREDVHDIYKIIYDEERHEEYFIELAKRLGCDISTRAPERKLYADLPLKERIRLARQHIMERQ